MPDFSFVKNPTTGKYVIIAPKRAKRPEEDKEIVACPFCPEGIKEEKLYVESDVVTVLANKFPFAPIHEVIIHSPDHHKNFGEFDTKTAFLVLKTFRERFNIHKDKGQVFIFHNRGIDAGESLFHPHSQLVVIPNDVQLEIPPMEEINKNSIEVLQTDNFYVFCPESSEWPDEVWITPDNSEQSYGEAIDEELRDLSQTITKVVQAIEKKLGKDFPYNFYIYPGRNWYIRLTPRIKKLGGFEVGTMVFVNTEDPKEITEFLKVNLNSKA